MFMKKGVKKRKKKVPSPKHVPLDEELTVPLWFVDGAVGMLGLTLYNFLIYLLAIPFGIGGIVKELEETMGYFGINFFIDLGFTSAEMITGLTVIFTVAFSIGSFVGNRVRKKYQQ